MFNNLNTFFILNPIKPTQTNSFLSGWFGSNSAKNVRPDLKPKFFFVGLSNKLCQTQPYSTCEHAYLLEQIQLIFTLFLIVYKSS